MEIMSALFIIITILIVGRSSSSRTRRRDGDEDLIDVNVGDEETYISGDESPEEVEDEEEDEVLAWALKLQEIIFSDISWRSSSGVDLGDDDDSDGYAIRCGICMEAKPPSQFMADGELCGGRHGSRFCVRCLDLYVSSKLDQNAAAIGCPEPGCHGRPLDPLRLRPVLRGSTFERWCAVLCRSMIENELCCPYGDCSAVMEGAGAGGHGRAGGGGGEEEITMAECPHCNRMFCARCGVTWHPGIGCRQRGRREEELLRKLAARMRWQTCPQCGITVERIDGCRFMRCRCGYCFCYICASPMSREYHYCYKCRT